MRGVRELAGDPGVDWFGFVDAGNGVVSGVCGLRSGGGGAYPVEKSKRWGVLSVFALGPVVGWKRRRTGAVWSISCMPVLVPCHILSPLQVTAVHTL